MTLSNGFIIAATRSGAGKTTITLGILSWLVAKGVRVQPFKCGPDFIDPTLHEKITGVPSYNLDLNMMGAPVCRQTFIEKSAGADISVIEGVMGLFDGGAASTAELAKTLSLPVILIIDARSSAQSCAAVLKGFETYDPELILGGVIFNKVGSQRHRELIEAGYSGHCRTPVLGYLPREADFVIPERHLGLHMGEEEPISEESLAKLANEIDLHISLEETFSCANLKNRDLPQKNEKWKKTKTQRKKRIAIAKDQAFCFYYQQNIELLELNDFQLIPFSPLEDTGLPADISMIYLGGGYPELFAEKLSKNSSFIAALKAFHAEAKPIYAECGGFMYLCEELEDMEGKTFGMAGLFPFQIRMGKRLRKLGYRSATLTADCLLGAKGAVVHGHEFHYSHIKEHSLQPDATLENLYLLDNSSHEGYIAGSALGSYVHLHLGRTPEVITSMKQYLERKGL